jgi:hypothetical protein
LHPINYSSRRVRHLFWVGTKELDSDRPFFRPKCDHLASPLVSMENTVSRNELGNDHISAVFFAQPAKNGIRYSGHWGQIERNLFRTKPRKHGGAASRRLQMTNSR